MSYTCIIPMFNEYPRIIPVLDEIIKVPEITQIVCVDDGSDHLDLTELVEKFPSVTFIKHNKNLGKLAAIRSGYTVNKGSNIILIDGDLKNLKHYQISKAISNFELHRLDCLLLCTVPVDIWDSLSRIFIRLPHAATGCRILTKKILGAVINDPNVQGYQIEPAMNKYVFDNDMHVAYTNISAVNVHKVKKIGLKKGILHEYAMWSQFLQYGGLWFNLKQALFFARKKI